jgi:hypothetical protein
MALHLLVAESCAAQEGVLSQTLASPFCTVFSGALKAAFEYLATERCGFGLQDEEGVALYALSLPGSGPVRVELGEGRYRLAFGCGAGAS